MVRRTFASRDIAVERLRFVLLAALAGGASATACGGQSASSGDEPGTSLPTSCEGEASYPNENGNVVACEHGFVHRAEANAGLLLERRRPVDGGPEPPPYAECLSDLACNDAPNGLGLYELQAPSGWVNHCRYACATDADCGEGSLCSCTDVDGRTACAAHPETSLLA